MILIFEVLEKVSYFYFFIGFNYYFLCFCVFEFCLFGWISKPTATHFKFALPLGLCFYELSLMLAFIGITFRPENFSRSTIMPLDVVGFLVVDVAFHLWMGSIYLSNSIFFFPM